MPEEILEFPLIDDMTQDILKGLMDERTLVINKGIDDTLVEKIIMKIIQWNKEDRYIIPEKRKPITIILNSIGGDMYTGNNIINVIESSKTKIRGVAMGLVASMAYLILLSCHERIAFKDSILLQHDGSIQVQNSTSKARDTMKFFEKVEKNTKDFVISHTNMDEAMYDKYYDSEYYMLADEAKENGCIDKIIGVDVDLDYLFE